MSEETRNTVNRTSAYYDEGKTDFFDVNEEFFLFDSDSLDTVDTRMYGFAVQPEGIFEKDNMTEEAAKRLDGSGVYVYVERKNGKITLRQDYNGSYGIYLFQKGDYFALSNSFFRLLDYIKLRYPLTMNRDFANHMLIGWLATFSYKETAVNEIEVVDKDQILVIDEQTRTLKYERENYHDNVYLLNTAEGLEVLDHWFYKWTTVLRNIKAQTNEMQVNLSGGFDSRITFLLMLKSGINLNEIQVHSINDGLHTHKEDYEIATEIADHFGFKLNNSTLSREGVRFSLKDAVNLEYYTKMTMHKEMYWKRVKFYNKRYSLPGNGGEAIRSHWDVTAEEFKKQTSSMSQRYSKKLATEMGESAERILDTAYAAVGEKYQIKEKNSKLYPLFTYRDVRCRTHFGKIAVEQFLSNSITLTPMIDPDIRSLQLNTPECQDNNLLMGMIYVRYCPELLNFRFEGNRSFDEKTIRYAKKINEQFPYHPEKYGAEEKSDFVIIPRDPEVLKIMNSGKNNEELPEDVPDKYMKSVFDSCSFRKTFETTFDEEIYTLAQKAALKNDYFPLRDCYEIIGLTSVIEDIAASQQLAHPAVVPHLDQLISQNYYVPGESAEIVELYKDYITARVEVKLQGILPDCEMLWISDSRAKVTRPGWFIKDGSGYVIESYRGTLELLLKAKTAGKMEIRLRGRDVRGDNGKRIPYWIDYEEVSYNEVKAFEGTKAAWHDKPVALSYKVKAGDTVRLHVEWHPHMA